MRHMQSKQDWRNPKNHIRTQQWFHFVTVTLTFNSPHSYLTWEQNIHLPCHSLLLFLSVAENCIQEVNQKIHFLSWSTSISPSFSTGDLQCSPMHHWRSNLVLTINTESCNWSEIPWPKSNTKKKKRHNIRLNAYLCSQVLIPNNIHLSLK